MRAIIMLRDLLVVVSRSKSRALLSHLLIMKVKTIAASPLLWVVDDRLIIFRNFNVISIEGLNLILLLAHLDFYGK